MKGLPLSIRPSRTAPAKLNKLVSCSFSASVKLPSHPRSHGRLGTKAACPWPCGNRCSPIRESHFVSTTAVSLGMAADREYSFPTEKTTALKSPAKTPLVLVSCGSFSPITYLHLRMFEMCKDWAKNNTDFEVVAGYLSPVSDAYKKDGLAKSYHRVEMCRRAAQESNWIMTDDWEAIQSDYTRTALVLDHFHHEINEARGGITMADGQKRRARICLMSGADLIQTMSIPGVWAEEDLDHILGRYGAFIIERSGTDLNKALEALQPWKSQIYPIPQLIQNDVSSTKIRNFLRKDMSIRWVPLRRTSIEPLPLTLARYLIPEAALKYIDAHHLFKEQEAEESGYKTSPSASPAKTMTNGHGNG